MHAACGSGGSGNGDDALDDALGGNTADRGRACSGGGVHSQISCHGHGTCMAIDIRRSWQRQNLAGDSSGGITPCSEASRPAIEARSGAAKIANKDLLCEPQKGLFAAACSRAMRACGGRRVRQVVRWKLGGRALGAGRIGERAKIRLRRPEFRSSGPDCEMLRMRATDSAFGRRRVGG